MCVHGKGRKNTLGGGATGVALGKWPVLKILWAVRPPPPGLPLPPWVAYDWCYTRSTVARSEPEWANTPTRASAYAPR